MVIGVVYYTDNRIKIDLAQICQKQLRLAVGDRPLVSVSLAPIDIGVNIVLPLKPHPITMVRQIIAGLEAIDTDVVYLAEHDVLYHPSYFDFVPLREDAYYYNLNFWIVRYSDGFAVKYWQPYLGQVCAYRKTLLHAFKGRLDLVETKNFHSIGRDAGYEPGAGKNPSEGIDKYNAIYRNSEFPNLDIKDHGTNVTHAAWEKNNHTIDWQGTYDIPYWGRVRLHD